LLAALCENGADAPIVLDQASPELLGLPDQGFGPDDSIREGKLRALRRADYFTSSGTRQHEYFRPWLIEAGWSEREIDERSAPVPYSLPRELARRKPDEELSFVCARFSPGRSRAIGLEAVIDELEQRRNGMLHFFGVDGQSAFDETIERSDRAVRHGSAAYDEVAGICHRAHVGIDLAGRSVDADLAPLADTVVFLSCGLPVLNDGSSELSDVIDRYDAGWSVDPSDTEEIRTVLAEIFGHRDLVTQKSLNALRLVHDHLDVTRTVEPLDSFVRRHSMRLSRLSSSSAPAAAEAD
jgi:hypothetical protein